VGARATWWRDSDTASGSMARLAVAIAESVEATVDESPGAAGDDYLSRDFRDGPMSAPVAAPTAQTVPSVNSLKAP